MSGDMQSRGLWDQISHEQARALSLESLDARLEPADAARLGDHLDSCPDCAAIDAEYRAMRLELRGLASPEVPRDLWARTSAALDRVDAAPTGLPLDRLRDLLGGDRRVLASAAAAVLVVVLVAVSVIAQNPGGTRPTNGASGPVAVVGSGGSGLAAVSPQAPLAVVGGTSYWISASAGVYEIKGGTSQCGAGRSGCSISGGQTLGSVQSDTAISAAIAPDASRAVVWTADKIAVLPLAPQSPTVSLDLLTPRPTTAATAAATPTEEPTGTPTSNESDQATELPSPTSSPTPVPTSTASANAAATGPVAILSGYEIVGLDPQFSADGTTLAFTARPVDHTAGPDVFVWRVGDQQAHAVTFRHSDQLAGWYGRQVLISEVTAATATSTTAEWGCSSYAIDPATGMAQEIDRPMLLPSSDPSGQFLIYWAGTLDFDNATGLWRAATGDLYFDSWANLNLAPTSLATEASPVASVAPLETGAVESAEPTSTDTSLPIATESTAPSLAPNQTATVLRVTDQPGQVLNWIVRWDSLGRNVAVWVASSAGSDTGRLSLFSVDRASGAITASAALPQSGQVLDGFGFDGGQLVYTSALDGKTYVQNVPTPAPTVAATPTFNPTPADETPDAPSPDPTDSPAG